MRYKLQPLRLRFAVPLILIALAGCGGDDGGDTTTGAHATLLADLSASIKAFHDATTELGVADQVTTFTASDFGRTYASNGDGSDHGWGGHHFVLGGAVKDFEEAFAREHGVIRLIAKGAHRRTKAGASKFDGGIDLLDLGDAVFSHAPERELCPFMPRVDVLPCPEAGPRPTRLRLVRAPSAGRRSSSLMAHLEHVGHGRDHPPDGRGVVVHHRVVDAAEAQGLDRRLLLRREPDDALRQRDLNLLACHQRSPRPSCCRRSACGPRASLAVA